MLRNFIAAEHVADILYVEGCGVNSIVCLFSGCE